MKEDYLFVSYSSKDKVFVDQVIAKIRKRNVNIWIDDELTKHVGEEWFDIVKDKVCSKYCKGILFFISKTSVTSPQVLRELQFAKSDEVRACHRGKDIRILPIETENHIERIDEWLYDLRDEKEDERDFNSNWKEEQKAIDLCREICFPDNNTLRIRLTYNLDAMIQQLFETVQKELPSVLSKCDKTQYFGNEIRETYRFERTCGSVIGPDLTIIRHKPVKLVLASGEKSQYPQIIEPVFHDGKSVFGRKNLTGADQADYCFDTSLTFISRKHFCIEQENGQEYIVDLGSSNGTYLNGVRLQPMVRYPLMNEAVIMISRDNQLKYKVSI